MNLRDILITLIVVGTLPFVLRHAYIGVLLWTWISVMNPHKLAWGFATNAQFAAIAAGATLIGMFTTRDRIGLSVNSVLLSLAAFMAWMGITTVAALDVAGSVEQLEKVFKILLMTVVALAVLQERKQLQAFVWVIVLSIGFYGAKGGLFTIRSGGEQRVWGPSGGFIEGNNEIGLALVIAIPLMYYLYLSTANRFVKFGLIALTLLSVVAAIGTHSRGAFIATGAMIFFLWWRSPSRALLAGPLVVACAMLLAFMPEQWADRMWTIQTYQQDSSAMHRINAWKTMVNIANDHFTGGGYSIYHPFVFQAYSPNPEVTLAAHSIYFQVLGEHGWVGLFLFIMIWVLTWRRATALRRLVRDDRDLSWVRHLTSMCQVSLLGYAVGGAFLSLAYFDLPYYVLVILLIGERLVKSSQTSETIRPAEGGRRLPRLARAPIQKADSSERVA